jgi:hypothetical protein
MHSSGQAELERLVRSIVALPVLSDEILGRDYTGRIHLYSATNERFGRRRNLFSAARFI